MFSDAELSERNSFFPPIHSGVFRNGRVELDSPLAWPDGTKVQVRLAEPTGPLQTDGHVVVAGFGPPGRWVADVLEKLAIPYALIEINPATVSAQKALGKRVVFGDVSDRRVLEAAGISSASMLVLTIPDEAATIRAIQAAKAVNPSVYVMARTAYTSSGMCARQAGADVVVSAEKAVAREFCERLLIDLGKIFSGQRASK